ncbi:MAG: glycosyltransferase [Bacteroidia bacterium]
MKILHVNTFSKGGAAKACIRLHQSLVQKNIASKIIFLKKNSEEVIEESIEFIDNYLPQKNIFQRAIRKCFRLTISNNIKQQIKKKVSNGEIEWFSFPDSDYDLTTHPYYQEADIIHLHWVADFIDFSFFKKNKKPIVWTLHDMNSFTGGCHYSDNCTLFKSDCNVCHQLGGLDKKTYSEISFNLKSKALKGVKNIQIVSPSTWLMNFSLSSKLFGNMPHYCIPYGIDCQIFKIKDKIKAREKLNFPIDKKIILFVADSIKNKRKGFLYLEKAVEKLFFETDFLLVIVGGNSSEKATLKNRISLGKVNDEQLMAAIYVAADVLVIPSTEDNLPNTALESLMCGTPIIAFPIGGMVDIIEHKVNGLLAKNISVEALEESLCDFFDEINKWNSEEIRANAIKKYSSEIQANAYIELYKKIIN